MKYNWNFINEFWWTDFYKWIKKKKKVAKVSISKSDRLIKIEPIFTRHSLQRLSERICTKYKKEWQVRAWKYLINWEFESWWIPPKLITDCILDIKHSMHKNLLYSDMTESFAINGKICIYIISRQHEIITLFKEFDKEQKKLYRAVANRDALIFFNL